jgi:hypothetical protein
MGIITPITNLLPLEISRPSDIEPQPVEKVESSPRTDDETYSPSNQQAGDGTEEEGREDGASPDDSASLSGNYESLASEDEADATAQPAEDIPNGQISFFA